MKRFKVNFGMQKMYLDFDSIYPESKFYKFPNIEELPSQMEVEVDDKYDKNTLIGALMFENEEYGDLCERWYKWINSKEGETWITEEVPECEDFIMDSWVIMIDSEEINKTN